MAPGPFEPPESESEVEPRPLEPKALLVWPEDEVEVPEFVREVLEPMRLVAERRAEESDEPAPEAEVPLVEELPVPLLDELPEELVEEELPEDDEEPEELLEDGLEPPDEEPPEELEVRLRSLRLPRNCGAVREEKFAAAVTPVSRRVRSTGATFTAAVRTAAVAR